MGAPSHSQLDSLAEVPQMSTGTAGMPSLMTAGSVPESEAYGEEEANKKDTAAADDLRELAAKGVCAPLWRTNQPVQPVSPAFGLAQTSYPVMVPHLKGLANCMSRPIQDSAICIMHCSSLCVL